jgi:hypothetical protein
LTTYDLVADFYSGDHAGIGETSLMLALRPDLVRLADWLASEALPGVIGDDPRPTANAGLGQRIFDESASRAAALVAGFRAGKLNRADWISTLQIVVEILEATRALRQKLPRNQVPAVTTSDYLTGWSAVANGRLDEAQENFRKKLHSLALPQLEKL